MIQVWTTTSFKKKEVLTMQILVFVYCFYLALVALPIVMLGRVIYCAVKLVKAPVGSAERAVRSSRLISAGIAAAIIIFCEAALITTIILLLSAPISVM